jgi:hypothetical protein
VFLMHGAARRGKARPKRCGNITRIRRFHSGTLTGFDHERRSAPQDKPLSIQQRTLCSMKR